jgi:DNA-binding transcriptional MocR family regulator
MSSDVTSANSRSVAKAVGHNQVARLLGGWASGDGALHVQLASRLRELVREGALPAGTRLPSERAMAQALNVSRNTVGVAFDQLRAEALLSSRRGDGTYVTLAGQYMYARGDDRLHSFLSAPAEHEPIDLRSAALRGLGLVADELAELPRADLDELVGTHGYIPRGLPALRGEVARYYTDIGLPTTAAQVLITSGAQQALRLAAATLLEPGATVLIEEPSFRGAIEVLRAAGARLVPVPSGACGIDITMLKDAIARHRPRLLLVQSTVQNPTGSVLGTAARRAISQCGVPVLDDASTADTLVDGPIPGPLAAFGGPVITIGSASKSFWGGLRVGWIRADPQAIDALASVKGVEDLGTSVIAQMMTARLLRRIDTARSQRAIQLGQARADALRAVAELFPEWQPQLPAGGASLWVRLPSACATALTQRGERCGVSVLPGPVFSSREGLDDHVRIGFAAPISQVTAGLHRLAEAWRHFR